MKAASGAAAVTFGQPVRKMYLLGIGGAAMAPLAGMLKERGYVVTGSDVGVYPPASGLLDSLGIPWREGYSAQNVRGAAPDLVIIGNVIARGNPELEYVLDERIPYRSMAATIEELFLRGHSTIVVAGTHGKTTTTAMLAWTLETAGRKPDFLAGGVVGNFGDRSYALGGGEEFVIEGDEYETAFFDRGPKFLHYHPDELVLTSCEFDHADIYADLDAVKLQFRRLVNLVPRRGKVMAWQSSGDVMDCVAKAFCSVETFGLEEGADWQACDVRWEDGRTCFEVEFRGERVARVRMRLGGNHNVLNALAAGGIASGRGVKAEAIERALGTFSGVRRRMEVKGESAGVMVVEDFAHHPTAIRVTIEAARTMWPGRRLWAAVEPRSNTMRRKVFEKELSESLALADAVLLGPVDRADLLAAEDRMNPEDVVEASRRHGVDARACGSARELGEALGREAKEGDVILVMSNGSFDGLCGALLEKLKERSEARR
jgi:UDP-N-acetylmuramate: L-alanyl-gamma-D-glutamyl-meso-diaminopimelate ligase